jgi:hypothetical protein
MKTHVTAKVIDGALALDRPIELPNETRVLVTIESVTGTAANGESTVGWQRLKRRLQQRPVHAAGLHFTRDQLHERD